MFNNKIFKVRYSEEYKYHYLEPYSDKFYLPNKIYGTANEMANRVWNSYVLDRKSTGVMLLGDQGSGKTLVGNIISNIAIDNNMPVIMVADIEASKDLIAYLSKLNNCVLYLDEFTKIFGWGMQKLMLTMLSDPINTKKIIIITDNDAVNISGLILNRPGRVRYRYDFNKMEKDAIYEYCKDYNVNDEFIKDIIRLYNTATVFSFDFLIHIVNEHLKYPNDGLDKIVSVLNLKILASILVWRIIEVKGSDGKTIPFNQPNNGLMEKAFKDANYNFNYNITLKEGDGKDINIGINRDWNGVINYNITESTNDEITITFKGYSIKFRLMEA